MSCMQTTFVSKQLVFVDESSKDDRTILHQYKQAPIGQRTQIKVDFAQGDCYSIVTSIIYQRYLSPRIVEGSVDSIKFLDYIASEVVSA